MVIVDGIVVGVGAKDLLVLTLGLPLATAALTATIFHTAIDVIVGCDGGDVVVGGVRGVSILGEALSHELPGVLPL